MNQPIRLLLEQITDLSGVINNNGGAMEQVTLYGDKLSEVEYKDAIDWLDKHGAKWEDDSEKYKRAGMDNTFHLWYGIAPVKLYCGFIYEGETDANGCMDFALKQRTHHE